MGTLQQLLLILLAAGLIWLLYRSIKNNPQAFTKENFSKSFGTMGVLGLMLIAFVGLVVFLLNST